MDGKWLSVLEFASYKNKSISTVRRYIKANRVKFKDENGKYFIWVKNYQDESNNEEKELFQLKLENERLKKENRVIKEEINELKMLVQIYESNQIQKTLEQDVIIEEFIEGKEYYIGVLGNNRLKVLPVWELVYKNVEAPEKEVYTARAKWNKSYRKRKGIDHQRAKLDKELEARIIKVVKRTYKALSLSGYARIDIRVDANQNIYILEANPNPNISFDDEFAMSAKNAGLSYKDLIKKVITLSQN